MTEPPGEAAVEKSLRRETLRKLEFLKSCKHGCATGQVSPAHALPSEPAGRRGARVLQERRRLRREVSRARRVKAREGDEEPAPGPTGRELEPRVPEGAQVLRKAVHPHAEPDRRNEEGSEREEPVHDEGARQLRGEGKHRIRHLRPDGDDADVGAVVHGVRSQGERHDGGEGGARAVADQRSSRGGSIMAANAVAQTPLG